MARGVVVASLVVMIAACSERKLASMPAFQGSKIIRPTVAFQLIRDNPTMMVIDVRTEEEFQGEQGHIAGAINIPVAKLPEYLRVGRFPKDRALLVYGVDTDQGDEGNKVLVERGYRYIFRIEDGIKGWRQAGLGTIATVDPP